MKRSRFVHLVGVVLVAVVGLASTPAYAQDGVAQAVGGANGLPGSGTHDGVFDIVGATTNGPVVAHGCHFTATETGDAVAATGTIVVDGCDGTADNVVSTIDYTRTGPILQGQSRSGTSTINGSLRINITIVCVISIGVYVYVGPNGVIVYIGITFTCTVIITVK